MTSMEMVLSALLAAVVVSSWLLLRAMSSDLRLLASHAREGERLMHGLVARSQDRMLAACDLSIKAKEIEADVEIGTLTGTGRPPPPPPSLTGHRIVEGFDGTLIPDEKETAHRNGFAPID